MRAFKQVLPILASLLVATQAPAFSGFVEVHNRSGRDIQALQVTHQRQDDWGADLLDGDVLSDGEAARIDVDGYPSPFVDLRATDANGDTYTFMGVNIATTDVTIGAGDKDRRAAGFDGYLKVTNRTGYSIVTLYVGRGDPMALETELLADSILADGQSVAVAISAPDTGAFNIRAVDEDGDTYTRWAVDIASEDVTFTGHDLD